MKEIIGPGTYWIVPPYTDEEREYVDRLCDAAPVTVVRSPRPAVQPTPNTSPSDRTSGDV
jgi:hypothetical protein